MKDTIYSRNCPDCSKELKTTNKYYFKKAVTNNQKCGSCSLKGRKFSDEHKRKLSENHADISGDKNQVETTNRNIVELATFRRKLPKLGDYLKFNYLKYYK